MKKAALATVCLCLCIASISCALFQKGAVLSLRFDEGDTSVATQTFSVDIDVRKIAVPEISGAENGKTLQFLPKEIIDLVHSGSMKKAELFVSMGSDQIIKKVDGSKKYADMNVTSKIDKFVCIVNGKEQDVALLRQLVESVMGENGETRINADGSVAKFPNLFGIELGQLKESNQYMGKLLTYLAQLSEYPAGRTRVGKSWNNDFGMFVPVGVISSGQSSGSIDVSSKIGNVLEKISDDIAYIKMNVSITVKWDVTVPQQGRSKLAFTLTGNGYRLFDIKNGRSYGMFLKSSFDFDLNAGNNNTADAISVSFSGKADFARKTGK